MSYRDVTVRLAIDETSTVALAPEDAAVAIHDGNRVVVASEHDAMRTLVLLGVAADEALRTIEQAAGTPDPDLGGLLAP